MFECYFNLDLWQEHFSPVCPGPSLTVQDGGLGLTPISPGTLSVFCARLQTDLSKPPLLPLHPVTWKTFSTTPVRRQHIASLNILFHGNPKTPVSGLLFGLRHSLKKQWFIYSFCSWRGNKSQTQAEITGHQKHQ